jgi:hypothetical protein
MSRLGHKQDVIPPRRFDLNTAIGVYAFNARCANCCFAAATLWACRWPVPLPCIHAEAYFPHCGKLPCYAVMMKSCLYDMLDLIHQHAIRELQEGLERGGVIRAAA